MVRTDLLPTLDACSVCPIEPLWEQWKADRAKHSATSQEALWHIVKSCWDNMSQQVLDERVASTPA